MLTESRFPKLISLLNKGQHVQPNILGSAVRSEFENVSKARRFGISWDEIAEALGFPKKGKLASASFSRERRRREKKGGVPSAKKTKNEKQQDEKSAGVGVMLLDNKKSSGACEIFKSFRSID